MHRTKLRHFAQLFLVALNLFFLEKIGYSGTIDQLCRSAPLLINELGKKTNGLTELGSACYGAGESLKIRISVAISAGYENLVKEKLHLKNSLKSFCENEELYKLTRKILIVWTYYTMDGIFHSEVYLNKDICEKIYRSRNK